MNVENSHLFPVSFFKSVIVTSVFNDNLEGPSVIGNEVEFAIMLLVVRWNRKDAKMPPRWWNVGQFCLGRSDAWHVEHLLTNLTFAAIHHRPHHPQAFVNQENHPQAFVNQENHSQAFVNQENVHNWETKVLFTVSSLLPPAQKPGHSSGILAILDPWSSSSRKSLNLVFNWHHSY